MTALDSFRSGTNYTSCQVQARPGLRLVAYVSESAMAIIKESNSLLFKCICLKSNSLKSGLGQGFTVQG